MESAYWHFLHHGFREGRPTGRSWRLVMDGSSIMRLRREDAEAGLGRPVRHAFGLLGFINTRAKLSDFGPCNVELWSKNGQILRRIIGEQRMLDTLHQGREMSRIRLPGARQKRRRGLRIAGHPLFQGAFHQDRRVLRRQGDSAAKDRKGGFCIPHRAIEHARGHQAVQIIGVLGQECRELRPRRLEMPRIPQFSGTVEPGTLGRIIDRHGGAKMLDRRDPIPPAPGQKTKPDQRGNTLGLRAQAKLIKCRRLARPSERQQLRRDFAA
jgi:hypothetical protein